jgi:hypothetical protein
VAITWQLSGVYEIAASALADFAADCQHHLAWTADLRDSDDVQVASLNVHKVTWQATDQDGRVLRTFEGTGSPQEQDGEGSEADGPADAETGREPS